MLALVTTLRNTTVNKIVYTLKAHIQQAERPALSSPWSRKGYMGNFCMLYSLSHRHLQLESWLINFVSKVYLLGNAVICQGRLGQLDKVHGFLDLFGDCSCSLHESKKA